MLLAVVLLQPMGEGAVTIEAWYMDDLTTDQRLSHRLVSAQDYCVVIASPGAACAASEVASAVAYTS